MAIISSKIILLVAGILSIIFLTACVSGRYWSKDTKVDQYAGIWEYCVHATIPVGVYKGKIIFRTYDDCWQRGDGPFKAQVDVFTWTYAVRVFGVLSVILSFAATGSVLFSLIKKTWSVLLLIIPLVLSGLSMAIAVIIYSASIERTPTGALGWSYILGWIGIGTSIIGSIVAAILSRFGQD